MWFYRSWNQICRHVVLIYSQTKFNHWINHFQLYFEDNFNYVVFSNWRYSILKNEFLCFAHGYMCVWAITISFSVDEHFRQLHEDMGCNVNLYLSFRYVFLSFLLCLVFFSFLSTEYTYICLCVYIICVWVHLSC